MQSSYRPNNFGELLYSIVRLYQPARCVELGCLEGYSSVHIARGLKANQRGHLTVIDLFEDYPFNSAESTTLLQNLAKHGVGDYCDCLKGSAFVESDAFPSGSIDFLHIDISNDGDVLEKIFNAWAPKLTDSAIIVFEGGSAERDQIGWMKEYDKRPIQDYLTSEKFTEIFHHFIFDPFPSLTICKKRT